MNFLNAVIHDRDRESIEYTVGIIDDSSESLFTYGPGQSFEGFRDPGFEPAFEPVFNDPELEQKADEICGDDQFCKFDIAATGNENIGLSTMQGGMDFDEIVVLAQPSELH